MEEYASNSHKSKASEAVSEKKVEKAISGVAKKKQKGSIQKFTDVFISEDMNSVKNYIFMDVVVPAVKKGISDIITNGIDMLLYGENGSQNRKPSAASKVSYRSYYDNNRSDRSPQVSRTRTGYNYDDIVLENRGEAEDVITRMDELVATYGMVSVADLYDLVGITCNYTDNKYGWTDVRSACVVRIREGYLIKMPKAMPLD